MYELKTSLVTNNILAAPSAHLNPSDSHIALPHNHHSLDRYEIIDPSLKQKYIDH